MSARDIRRMNHFAEQAHEALLAFEGIYGTENTLETFRRKVQRLTDAGQRSGLSLTDTADFFAGFVAERPSASLPSTFLNAAGQFDAESLLSSVALYYKNAAPQLFDYSASDDVDMAAINSVAQQFTPAEPVNQNLVFTVVDLPAIVVEAPTIDPNAPQEVRALLERVQLKGENWIITVEQGDSLAQFANALYGDRTQFQRIFEANITVLRTPNSLTIGQELVLPKD